MPDQVTYTGGALDRAALLRQDDAWINARLGDNTTRLLPVWRGRNLILPGDEPRLAWVNGGNGKTLLGLAGEVVLLGINGESTYFALDVSACEDTDLVPLTGGAEFMDLRQAGAVMELSLGAMLAFARAIMHWHGNNRFCGVCGTATESRHAGHVRTCTNTACRRDQFPRTDPAVIMLVTRPGPDGGYCLLGRKSQFPQGMYSTLAGFVEPGESLEEAVIREVKEESGIDVTDVQYRASQPWPFPASLMLGYRAVATSTTIDFDREELDDAQWFTRAQVAGFGQTVFGQTEFDGDGPRLPRVDSISRWLIDEWLEEA